jgi:hypothetical protein
MHVDLGLENVKKFTTQRMLEQYVKIYKELMASKNKGTHVVHERNPEK